MTQEYNGFDKYDPKANGTLETFNELPYNSKLKLNTLLSDTNENTIQKQVCNYH